MIKRKCSNCGLDVTFLTALFASRAFPLHCQKCNTKQFRRHNYSKYLVALGGSIGLFALLFVFMENGFLTAKMWCISFVCVLLITYILELTIVDLTEYTKQEDQEVKSRSRNNIWIFVVVALLGVIFYVSDL